MQQLIAISRYEMLKFPENKHFLPKCKWQIKIVGNQQKSKGCEGNLLAA